MKKTILAVGLSTLLSANANADALGIYLGGQVWDADVTGQLGETGSIEKFNFSGNQLGNAHVALEHPIPIIPNAKVSWVDLGTDGGTTLSQEFEFADITFPVGTEVTTNLDVSYVDFTLYYEVFSNDLFAFDFGLSGRNISGDVNVASASDSADLAFSTVIPMVYAKTVIGLPLTGFNIFAEGNLISLDGNSMHDYQVGVGYELLDNWVVDLDLQIGYRSLDMQLSDVDNLYADLVYDGVFAGAVIHF